MASTTVKLLRTLLVAAATATAVALLLGPKRRRPVPHSEARYAANESTGVFHRIGCRRFDGGADAPAFTTRDEALAEGYRPCGICRP